MQVSWDVLSNSLFTKLSCSEEFSQRSLLISLSVFTMIWINTSQNSKYRPENTGQCCTRYPPVANTANNYNPATFIYETAMQQRLRFSFPSCWGGGRKASEWTGGPQPRLDLQVGSTIAFCLLRGQGGGGPGGGTTSRGGERVRSRFRFLLRSLCSSILQSCLSIGNSISYIITKDVWYGILCHGLSLCAHSDCACSAIFKEVSWRQTRIFLLRQDQTIYIYLFPPGFSSVKATGNPGTFFKNSAACISIISLSKKEK